MPVQPLPKEKALIAKLEQGSYNWRINRVLGRESLDARHYFVPFVTEEPVRFGIAHTSPVLVNHA
ncbi:hypothetical protein IDH44_17405 [Paenibacillus sp. IB182496]|uniref:Uncharacterized protein n=1 Tax=Paenibacillus sabuli TaxID=2772509 RepID=A0A927GTR7_9BACL|nr:hypothetical protein [Paenibacillus sabuli]MBD2846977.1 hypothetical protein [Paenibacillus sabuli]